MADGHKLTALCLLSSFQVQWTLAYPVLSYTALGLSEQRTGFQLMPISVDAFRVCVRVLAAEKNADCIVKVAVLDGLNQGESQSKLANDYGLGKSAVCGWILIGFTYAIIMFQTELGPVQFI